MLPGKSSNYNGLDKLPHLCAFSLKTAAESRKVVPCPCTFQNYCEVVKENTNITPWKFCVDRISGQWFFILSVPEVLSLFNPSIKQAEVWATDWLLSLPCLSSSGWAAVSPVWMWHTGVWASLGCQSCRSSVPRAPPWWRPWDRVSCLPWWWCFGHEIVRWGWEGGPTWDVHLQPVLLSLC